MFGQYCKGKDIEKENNKRYASKPNLIRETTVALFTSIVFKITSL